MRFIPRAATALLLAASGLSAAPDPAPPAGDAVAIKVVNYADLVRTVHEHQGQVIVVDFWGEY